MVVGMRLQALTDGAREQAGRRGQSCWAPRAMAAGTPQRCTGAGGRCGRLVIARRPGVQAWRVLLVALWLVLAIGLPAIAADLARADGGAPNLAYVVGGGADGGDLVVIDVAQGRVSARIHVGGAPQSVLLSSDGGTAYVTQSASDSLAVVDVRTQRVVATVPAGHVPEAMAASVVTLDAYVADAQGDAVTVLDLNQRRVVGAIPVGKHPAGVAVVEPIIGDDGSLDADVYVANRDSGTVSVISATRQRVIATIPAPGGPTGVVVPYASEVAYVATRAGSILAVDLASQRLIGTLLERPGGVLGAMDYDALTDQIYVPDAAHGVVYVLRPAAGVAGGARPTLPSEPARTMTVAGGPAAVAVTFDGAYLFVAEGASGQVTMYDAAARNLLATVVVGGAPRALITGPYPPPTVGVPSPPASLGRPSGAGQLPAAGFFAAFVLTLVLALGGVGVSAARYGWSAGQRRGTATNQRRPERTGLCHFTGDTAPRDCGQSAPAHRGQSAPSGRLAEWVRV